MVTYNGEDRSEAELRAGVARVFCVCDILKQCGIFAPRFMPPLRGSHLFFWGRFPGFRPLRGSTAGLFYTAPPGLKFRLPSSLLRSYAEVGACARKLSYTPFNFRFIGYLENAENLYRAMHKKAPRYSSELSASPRGFEPRFYD